MRPKLLLSLMMALGTAVQCVQCVHASAELKDPGGTCPQFWFPFNRRCYKYVGSPTLLSWRDAEQHCKSMNSTLVSLLYSEENVYVRALVLSQKPSDERIWIGLNNFYEQKRWMWSDCSVLSYTNWARGEPTGGIGQCVYKRGPWVSASCGVRLASVCVRLHA